MHRCIYQLLRSECIAGLEVPVMHMSGGGGVMLSLLTHWKVSVSSHPNSTWICQNPLPPSPLPIQHTITQDIERFHRTLTVCCPYTYCTQLQRIIGFTISKSANLCCSWLEITGLAFRVSSLTILNCLPEPNPDSWILKLRIRFRFRNLTFYLRFEENWEKKVQIFIIF